jgi:hypothetical protein
MAADEGPGHGVGHPVHLVRIRVVGQTAVAHDDPGQLLADIREAEVARLREGEADVEAPSSPAQTSSPCAGSGSVSSRPAVTSSVGTSTAEKSKTGPPSGAIGMPTSSRSIEEAGLN